MRLSERIKLAVFTGLIVGLLFGIIDILARSVSFAFEWFEFYQSLLINMGIFTLGFVILGLFIELLRKIIKLNLTKKNLSVFYFITAISVMLLIYGEVFIYFVINVHLFPRRWDKECHIASIVFPFVVGLIYIVLLIKGRKLALRALSFFQRKWVKMFLRKCISVALVFIVLSLPIDLYLLNYTPSFKPKTELKGNPNIILITLDAARADHLSLYNYPFNTTPNINKLAENAVVFENAITPSSWSLPSHLSLLTGKYPSNHGGVKKHQYLDNKETTLAEILKANGYNTAGFIGGIFEKAKYGFSQGFITYKDRLDFFEYELTFNEFDMRDIINKYIFSGFNKYVFRADGEKISEELNKEVFKWLDKNKDSAFFMFITYCDPHDPYNLGTEFRKYFTNETRSYKEVKKTIAKAKSERYAPVSEDVVSYIIKLYDTEIFYLDYNLGKLFKKLDELGIKDNTIIIITADHGDEFYEHGSFTHSTTLYEEAIHVPLIIYYPKELKPQRIEKRVETFNVFSTILDILQIKSPENIDSISLLPLIKNGSFNRDCTFSELVGRSKLSAAPDIEETTQQTITCGDWKLIEVSPEKKGLPSSLFNLRTDPKEQNNLYDIEIEKRKMLQKKIAEITGDVNEKLIDFSQGLI